MEYEKMLKIIIDLEKDNEIPIYCDDFGIELSIKRPSVIPKNLINKVDPDKNFQIYLKENEHKKFNPHLPPLHRNQQHHP